MSSSTFSSDETSPSYTVRLGVWTNWSRGPNMGLTLTLSRQNADLLIAFTAFFVSFVGARFWRILCLVCHRSFSSSAPEDTLHHQRQVVLRNSSTAESGLWAFVRLFWAWRRRGPNYTRRLLPMCLIALACGSAFVTAGGFSARMSSILGDEVLMDGRNCSRFNSSETSDFATSHEFFVWSSRIMSNARNYAQQCYNTDTAASTSMCTTLVKSRLQSSRNTTASCPFRNEVCRSQSSNLVLDTGYIDSHLDLGLNSPPEKRILLRYMMHCAPLEVAGHESGFTLGDASYTRYNYGPNSGAKGNFTEQVLTQDTQYINGNFSPAGSDYRINGKQANMANGAAIMSESDFSPDVDVYLSDADITLLFLSGNGVVSTTPISDPWYRMSKPIRPVHRGSSNSSMTYGMDVAASVLGCAARYQFCNSNQENCGPLSSAQDAVVGAAPLFGTTPDTFYDETPGVPETASRWQWMMEVMSLYPASAYAVVTGQGTTSLVSRQSMNGGVQGALPEDQWKDEVTSWWSTILASWQAMLVNTAHGVDDSSSIDYRGLPQDQYQKDMCYNQKIRSTLHGSFSMFALLFTYIAGVLVIISSYIIEPILGCLYRRNKYATYKHLEWITNSELQQQRLAHEAWGSGDWENCTSDVPVTDAKMRLGCLDLSEMDHPRILIPAKDFRNSPSHSRKQGNLSGARGDIQPETFDQNEIAFGQIAGSSMGSVVSVAGHSDSRSNCPPMAASGTKPGNHMAQPEKGPQTTSKTKVEATRPNTELNRGKAEISGTRGTEDGRTMTM